MKIAILGSAPSSIGKAPFGDPAWKIWACSPGAYPVLARVDEFWEVHRWEPGKVGQPGTQKPWFTPEYIQWLKTVPPVLHVADPDALKDCPNAVRVPIEDLESRYGSYVWTSSVSYMTAMAIDKIQAERDAQREELRKLGTVKPAEIEQIIAARGDAIGFWGVDMAATDELYTSQRFACQWFIQLIVALGIEVQIPPESDLQTPPPKYGFAEISHRSIKWLARQAEIEGRLAQAKAREQQARDEGFFLQGALDDHKYHQTMWMNPGEDSESIDMPKVLGVERVSPDSRVVKRYLPIMVTTPPAVMTPDAKAADRIVRKLVDRIRKAKKKVVRKKAKKAGKKKRR